MSHRLVAFVDSRVWPSTVDAVSVSSCIGPTIIYDPARVPEHEILTVSTGVKIILADLGSTCNVLLSPAVLTLLVDWDQYFTVLIIQSLVVTPARFVREEDTGISHISFRLSKPHGLDLRLVGLIFVSEILYLGLRQLPFWSVLMITVSTCPGQIRSSSSPRLRRWLARVSPSVVRLLLALLFFCSRVLGCRSLAVFASRILGFLPWLFLFLHGHLARVSTSLQFTPLV